MNAKGDPEGSPTLSRAKLKDLVEMTTYVRGRVRANGTPRWVVTFKNYKHLYSFWPYGPVEFPEGMPCVWYVVEPEPKS